MMRAGSQAAMVNTGQPGIIDLPPSPLWVEQLGELFSATPARSGD